MTLIADIMVTPYFLDQSLPIVNVDNIKDISVYFQWNIRVPILSWVELGAQVRDKKEHLLPEVNSKILPADR